ncbi:hypothetical protein B0H12DRAFT_1040249 [Mycena haematopus]|nr:hypothetical protein B0H12DRAFT_1040249 [Mycena haematopus]
MLLDILDNLPRLRMSSNQLKMILWLLKECNVSNVPSYNGLCKMQDQLQKFCGNTIARVRKISSPFFTMHCSHRNYQDFSNPQVAKHLQFYPEETTGPISELWQAQQ